VEKLGAMTPEELEGDIRVDRLLRPFEEGGADRRVE
jgi:hypothetical protein